MSHDSRTIRIFLSSTFRDFAEERDLLVRKVFPELRRHARQRQVEVVDVDLRWGITEKEAQQGKVLPICLAEIDRARPYFIGFLGERYGWVPGNKQYDPSLLTEQPWLEPHRGDKSVTELEILHGVLNNPKMAGRAFFYFRDPRWSKRRGAGYTSEGQAEKARLDALKERIRRSGFPLVENYRDPAALAERVKADVRRLIDETYPADAVPDALTSERMMHAAFGATRRRLHVGGEKYFRVLDRATAAGAHRPVLVTGPSGGGKTALLANWVAEWSRRHPSAVVVTHHVGCGTDPGTAEHLAGRLRREIGHLTGEPFAPEDEAESALEMLPAWLERGSAWARREGRQLLVVLDGLERLSSRGDLRWLPVRVPPRVQLVVSGLAGGLPPDARGRRAWRELKVRPFTRREQADFIRRYLGRYRKALTPRQTKTLLAHPLSGSPLFLRTVLEELRVFGVHEELDHRLATLLSPPSGKKPGGELTHDDVFGHVLARIGQDAGAKPLRAALEAIWASRAGLHEDELRAIAGLAPLCWAEIRNALDEGLYETGGRIQFAHDHLRRAVADRYQLTGRRQRGRHQRLAAHFSGRQFGTLLRFAAAPTTDLRKVEEHLELADRRVAEELPWQLERAGDRAELRRCLTTRRLFEALLDHEPYELLGYWSRLGKDISAEYQRAWRRWSLGDEDDGALGEQLDQVRAAIDGAPGDEGGHAPEPVQPEAPSAPSRAPASWGRDSLRRATEAIGLEDHATFTDPAGAGALDPTLVLRLPGGRDALVEVCPPWRGLWARSRAAPGLHQPGFIARCLRHLRGQIRALAERDHTERFPEALAHVVLFVPDDALLRLAIRGDPEVLSWAARKQVLLASPASLGSVLFSMHRLFHGRSERLRGNSAGALARFLDLAGCHTPFTLGLCEWYLKTGAADSPEAPGVMGILAACHAKAGRQREALALRVRALGLSRGKLGAEHPATLRAMLALAEALRAAGRQPGALTFLRWCAAVSPAVAGAVRYDLACHECLGGNLEAARRLLAAEIVARPEMRPWALQDADLRALRGYIRAL